MPRIHGIVVGPDDRPIPEAAVFVIGGPGVSRDIGALTKPDGSFRLTLATPGTYRVRVFAEGEGSAEVEVQVGDGKPEALRILLQ